VHWVVLGYVVDAALTRPRLDAECCFPRYWVSDPTTDKKRRELFDGSVLCMPRRYSIRVDLCPDVAATGPHVTLRLANSSCAPLGTTTRPQRRPRTTYLWGNRGRNMLPDRRPISEQGGY
jgi:hypothetical protein